MELRYERISIDFSGHTPLSWAVGDWRGNDADIAMEPDLRTQIVPYHRNAGTNLHRAALAANFTIAMRGEDPDGLRNDLLSCMRAALAHWKAHSNAARARNQLDLWTETLTLGVIRHPPWIDRWDADFRKECLAFWAEVERVRSQLRGRK